MAHWAKIDNNNIVVDVTVGNNEELDEGYGWLINNIGGTWIKTSYNTKNNKHFLGGVPFRGNYAGIGFIYNEEFDIFIPPKPTDDSILDIETASWITLENE